MKNYKYVFLFALVMVAQFFASCNEDSIDKTNDPIPYEPIGGYETSDAVAADHLITKLSFDDNLTDSKSNITGIVGTKVAYAAGIKGNAYSGSKTENRYAIGNGTAKITALNSYTISFWLNSANTVPDGGSPGQGKGAQGIFSIVRPLDFWGGLNVFLQNPNSTFPDRLLLIFDLHNGRTGVAWKDQTVQINIDNSLNKWIHIVFTYNPTSSVASAYVNGVFASNLTGFPYAPPEGVVGSATLYADNPGGLNNPNNAPKYGDYVMTGTNGKVVFGTHQFETIPPLNNGTNEPWATSLVGLLDEFRIYDSVLTNSEVSALYKLEKDNR